MDNELVMDTALCVFLHAPVGNRPRVIAVPHRKTSLFDDTPDGIIYNVSVTELLEWAGKKVHSLQNVLQSVRRDADDLLSANEAMKKRLISMGVSKDEITRITKRSRT